MSQIPYFNPSVPLDFRNRKGGLVAMGIVMIVIGAMAGCLTIAAPLGLLMRNSTAGMNSSRIETIGVIFSIVLYAVVATGMIWTGIGSIRAQRWVRPIVLVIATMWLCAGIPGFVMVLIAMTNLPGIMAATQTGAATTMPVPQAAVVVGGVIAVVFSFVLYIVMPGVAILFYRPIDVRRTLEFYDPQPRWTDHCPLPVLGMSVACIITAASLLMASGYGMIFLFGVLLTGASAFISLVPAAALLAWAAVLIYRRRMLGWNLAVTIALIGQAAMIVSAFFYDLDKLAAAMHATTQETEMMRSSPTSHPLFMASFTTVVTVAALIYAIRIRHYFKAPEPAPPITPAA